MQATHYTTPRRVVFDPSKDQTNSDVPHTLAGESKTPNLQASYQLACRSNRIFTMNGKNVFRAASAALYAAKQRPF
jgi:hypothetical protein